MFDIERFRYDGATVSTSQNPTDLEDSWYFSVSSDFPNWAFRTFIQQSPFRLYSHLRTSSSLRCGHGYLYLESQRETYRV